MWLENTRELVNIDGIDDFAYYSKGVVQAVKNGRRFNLYVGGFDPEKPWHKVVITEGEALSGSAPSGILLERNTAEEYDVKVGDTLTIEVKGRHEVATIRGLFSGALPGESRFTLGFHRKLAGLDDRSTGLFVKVNGDTDPVVKALSKNVDVQQTLIKSQVSNDILNASGQVTSIIRLGTIISIAIAALLVFACFGYTVLQRQSEYQLLRLLGYQNSFITLIIMVEIALLGLAALILAIPIGALTAEYINHKLSSAWFQIDTIVSVTDYLKTFIPGFLFLPVVAFPLARMVLKAPVSDSLRSGDIA